MDGLQGTWGKYDFENLDFEVESEFFCNGEFGNAICSWMVASCLLAGQSFKTQGKAQFEGGF